jgi:PAS domain-containing protein
MESIPAHAVGSGSEIPDRARSSKGRREAPRSQITKQGLVLADRVALVALGGIIVSMATWVAFSYVDSMVLLQGTFRDELITPQPEQTLARLGTVVLVLVGTLVIQVLYSRRIQAEELLRLAEARIVQMYENSPDSVLCVRGDHMIVYANTASCEHAASCPKSAGDLVGEVCYRSIYGREQPCDACLVADVLKTAEVHNRTVIDTGSGASRYLEQIVYPVLDERGRVESAVETTRDTTERVIAMQMIRSMAGDVSTT